MLSINSKNAFKDLELKIKFFEGRIKCGVGGMEFFLEK
jgi:hypothetical protein